MGRDEQQVEEQVLVDAEELAEVAEFFGMDIDEYADMHGYNY